MVNALHILQTGSEESIFEVCPNGDRAHEFITLILQAFFLFWHIGNVFLYEEFQNDSRNYKEFILTLFL